jgi:hypothetical protein
METMSSGAGEYMRRETAKHDLWSVLDRVTSIKGFDEKLYMITLRFTEDVMNNLNKAYGGDNKALEEAERLIRDMEAAYHTTPADMRTLVSTRTEPKGQVTDSDITQLLQAWKPPTRWDKYGVAIVVGLIVGIVGPIATFVIIRYFFHGP